MKKNFLNEEHQQRSDLLEIYQAALLSVNGRDVVKNSLAQLDIQTKVSLIAIGKAAAAMAEGALDCLGEKITDGLIITKTGHFSSSFPANFKCLESDHPIPGENSLLAGQVLLDYCRKIPSDRQVVFCISGGASSLVEALPQGISLQELQQKNTRLVASGSSIEEINKERKKISLIKGGKLAAILSEQRIDVLVISDVHGDDLAVIGSGPLYLPERNSGGNIQHHIVANLDLAKNAAGIKAEELDYSAYIHHHFIDDEVTLAADLIYQQLESAEPGIHIWGGEPVVELPENPGRGGRNQHLALLLASKIQGRKDILTLVAGTDGTDGPANDAGALVDGSSISRGTDEGMAATEALMNANSGEFLEASGDLITTGPTQTNVMDLIIALKK